MTHFVDFQCPNHSDDVQKSSKIVKCWTLSTKRSCSYIAKGAESPCDGKVDTKNENIIRNDTMLTFIAFKTLMMYKVVENCRMSDASCITWSHGYVAEGAELPDGAAM